MWTPVVLPRNVLQPIAKKLVPFSLPCKTSVEVRYYFVLFHMTAVHIPHPPQNMILNFKAKIAGAYKCCCHNYRSLYVIECKFIKSLVRLKISIFTKMRNLILKISNIRISNFLEIWNSLKFLLYVECIVSNHQ